jgi:ParB-like chromosome segregation protein Spo0J
MGNAAPTELRGRQMDFHPLANLFPLIDGAEFNELVADISEHGLHEAIVIYEDKILDGRNRFRGARPRQQRLM